MTAALTPLVGSRICHDLVNPLGAIGNGVELMSLSGKASEELTLIKDAVEAAVARLNFFRIAYGAAPSDQTLPRDQITAILGTLSHGTRLRYRWEIVGEVPRPQARKAFLGIQCLTHALPLGGSITISLAERLTLIAEGKRIREDPRLWEALAKNGEPEDLASGEVQFGLLSSILRDEGHSAEIETSPAHIALRL